MTEITFFVVSILHDCSGYCKSFLCFFWMFPISAKLSGCFGHILVFPLQLQSCSRRKIVPKINKIHPYTPLFRRKSGVFRLRPPSQQLPMRKDPAGCTRRAVENPDAVRLGKRLRRPVRRGQPRIVRRSASDQADLRKSEIRRDLHHGICRVAAAVDDRIRIRAEFGPMLAVPVEIILIHAEIGIQDRIGGQSIQSGEVVSGEERVTLC